MSAPFSQWPWRAAAAEFMATGFLLIAIVGSGIAAERLSGGNMGLALLANAIATGGALFALIVVFCPVSGAHMNPAVTLAAAILGGLGYVTAALYIVAQISGGVVGVWLAHMMFDMPILETSRHVRAGLGHWTA
ncbi:MAG: aquaporin, partial [Rhodospirillaceae bacterium]|nr:aquaporin [Rhodospirillaceae bacterium]